jgi:hypothetical protein
MWQRKFGETNKRKSLDRTETKKAKTLTTRSAYQSRFGRQCPSTLAKHLKAIVSKRKRKEKCVKFGKSRI